MNQDKITLAEFIDYVKNNIDFDDLDSIQSATPMLIKLSNDKELLPKAICDELRNPNNKFQDGNTYQTSGYILYKDSDFIIRAVCWIPDKNRKVLSTEIDPGLLIYEAPHDHDFSFLTVGYYGPGYHTETYEYDYDSVLGENGEDVEMKEIPFNKLNPDQTFFFRSGKEIHLQLAPDDLSISLNFIVRKRGPQRFMDQYWFDFDKKQIVRSLENDTFRRAQTIPIIADLLGKDCIKGFSEIKDTHSCRRTRIEVMKELTKLNPDLHEEIWSKAILSSDPVIFNAAKKALELSSIET